MDQPRKVAKPASRLIWLSTVVVVVVRLPPLGSFLEPISVLKSYHSVCCTVTTEESFVDKRRIYELYLTEGRTVYQFILCVVVVVVFTLTDRASTIPSNIRGCQSGTWSQRGTKVNGSHHGDNPLLRPTGIQIATKSYATLQAMAPTNSKTVHHTSFTPYREQPRSTRIVVAYPQPAFSATNRTNTFQPVLKRRRLMVMADGDG